MSGTRDRSASSENGSAVKVPPLHAMEVGAAVGWCWMLVTKDEKGKAAVKHAEEKRKMGRGRMWWGDVGYWWLEIRKELDVGGRWRM